MMFQRKVVSHGVDGIAVWEKRGARDSDWEVFYVDRERDGMSPLERKRYLSRISPSTRN